MGLIVPTPGWIASHIMHAGTPVALAVMGIAVTLDDGKAGDSDINAYLEDLANTDDSVFMLNSYYRELEADYPFLKGYLGGITRWTEAPGTEQYTQVRDIAAVLSTIEWSSTEPEAGGDLLGRVKNQMDSIAAKRTKVFDYTSIEESMIEWMAQAAFRPIGRIMDAWCGSGTRIIAAMRYQQLVNGDTGIPVLANDPSAIAIAMTGLNLVGYGITGPNVSLRNDREWAEIWGTSTFYGSSPAIRRTLPPEISRELPRAKGKRL